jgi:HNH endonuclease
VTEITRRDIRAERVGVCSYCGFEGRMTLDHVVPRVRGGTLKVLACGRCNQKKADLMPEAWYAWLDSEPGREWLRDRHLQGGPLGGHPNNGVRGLPVPRARGHRSGYCDECGGKLPNHFTRCASLWARQNDAGA